MVRHRLSTRQIVRTFLWLIVLGIICYGSLSVAPYINQNLPVLKRTLRDQWVSNFHAENLTEISATTALAIRERNYTKASNGSVFIFSAFERCPRNKVLLVNIWELRPPGKSGKSIEPPYACCFLPNNGSVTSRAVTWRLKFWCKARLLAVKLQCKVPEDAGEGYAVTIVNSAPVSKSNERGKASESIGKVTCPTNTESYVVPEKTLVPETYNNMADAELRKMDHNCLPQKKRRISLDNKETFSFAICAKLAFGSLSPHVLIEWLEYNLKMGATMFLVYTHNLNAQATRVLRHYERKGKLVTLPFDLPLNGSYISSEVVFTNAFSDLGS